MYIILVLSNFLVASFCENKKIILFYFILSFTLVVGLRYDVGIDYKGYEYLFLNHFKNTEIGYRAVSELIYLVGAKFYYLTTLIGFLTILPIAYFFYSSTEKKEDLRVGILLYLISGFIFSTMNLMRQGLAVSIIFLAIYFYYKNNQKLFFILFFLAFLFHKSSIICLVLFLIIDKINTNKYFSIFLLIVMYIFRHKIPYTEIYIKFIRKIDIFYSKYSLQGLIDFKEMTINNSSGLNLGILSLIIIFILILLIRKDEKKLKYYEKLMFFSIVFRLISIENFIFNRISIFFDLFIFLTIFMFYLENKYNEKEYVKMVKYLIIFILGINFLKIGYLSPKEEKNKYNLIKINLNQRDKVM